MADSQTLSLDRYQPEAKSLIAGAQQLADERKHALVLPLHLVARAVERHAGVREVFRRALGDLRELEALVNRALTALPQGKEPAYLSTAMLDLLERARREADRDRAEQVGVEQVLNALTQEIRGPLGEVFSALGQAPGFLRQHLSGLNAIATPSAAAASSTLLGSTAFARSMLEPALLKEPVLARLNEVRRLLTIVERREKCHALLVGEAGVGRASVVRALAQRIAQGDVPTRLSRVRVLEMDTGALSAGARLRGEVEERVRKLLSELSQPGSEAILVVREIDQLFGQGQAGSLVGDVLRSALTKGDLRIIGTTTAEGLRKIQEKDSSVLRLFTLLPIEEPNLEQAREMVRGVTGRYEAHHAVQISESAILAAVELAKRYVRERHLPESALGLLDEAAAAKRVETDGISAEADSVLRRAESLKVQLEALAGGVDEATQRAEQRLGEEYKGIEEQAAGVRRSQTERRAAVEQMRHVREQWEARKAEREQAQQDKNLGRVAELDAKILPELEQNLASAEAEARRLGASHEPRFVTAEDIAATLAVWTGIPVAKMLEGEAEKLLKMEERLSERVIGQDEPVRALSRAVRRGRIGLRDPKRPIGSFLFLGPSGVGKTELAKALAQFLFDDEQALTRLDMSEFMERHMAQRLIGAPPGYADSEQGGFLTEAVRKRPYSVLLFDEVEKAHQDVFNLLLQLLDDGRLTDGRGRLADFSNTVVIMTSNIGSERILESDARLFESNEGREALRDVLLERLRQFFRPELLNRIDELLVFRPLTREHLDKVVDIQLRQLNALLSQRELLLELEPAAKARVVELGYEPALGARPVKRAILRWIQDPLAQALLSGNFPPGTLIVGKLEGDEIKFEARA